jgi:hypothetical protein
MTRNRHSQHRVFSLCGLAFIILAMTIISSVAVAEDWVIEAGWSQRRFSDIDFAANTLTNSAFAGVDGGTESLTFVVDPADPGVWQLASANEAGGQVINADPDYFIFADSATLDEASESDNADGTFINLSKAFESSDDGTRFNFGLGLAFFEISSGIDSSASVGGANTGFTTSTTTYSVAGPPGYVFDTPGGPDAVFDSEVAGSLQHSAITAKSDVDADLIVLSFGVEAAFDVGSLEFSIEGGPTLNYADVDSEISHSTVIGTTGDSITGATSASDSEFVFGLYGRFGLAWRITEEFDVGLGARYDYGDDVGTDLVDIGLDGESYDLRFTYRF